MLFFPNAKINIGLNVIKKRDNGYHDIETIFCPVELKDVLEFVVAPHLKDGTIEFSISGKPIDGSPDKNLCVKAYHLLSREFKLPAITAHLHKKIPLGAGLGGGSSDAAFMLKKLNENFQLDIPEDKLSDYASELGSDCAFFIKNKPLFAFGRGNEFRDIKHITRLFEIILIYPGIHVGTSEAYSGVVPHKPVNSLKDLINSPIEEWKGNIINDFELSVFQKHPEIKKIKDKLYETGALYASMTGSGSTVYGLYHKAPNPTEIYKDYFCWSGQIFKSSD